MGWPHELVDLKGCLGGVEDDGHGSRGTFRRAQQRDRLLSDPSGVPGKVERLDRLPAGADLVAPEAVGKAAGLHVVIARGGGIETAAGFDDRLIQYGTFAGGEMAHLANELERAFADPDLRDERHRQVGAHEQVDLVVERDSKRIANHRRSVLADQCRRRRQPDRDPVHARRCLGDPDGLPRRLLDAGGGEVVDAGESPGAAGDDADADSLILEQLHRRHGAVLDGEPLHRAIDHTAIGI